MVATSDLFPGLVGFSEAARLIGVPESTLRKHLARGRIRPVAQRLMRSHLFDLAEVERAAAQVRPGRRGRRRHGGD